VRDIVLVGEKHSARARAALAEVDMVFVHSDPSVQPFLHGQLNLDGCAYSLEYTGYVTPRAEPSDGRRGELDCVVVHAGGGRDGAALWEALDVLEGEQRSVKFIRCGQAPGAQMKQTELLGLLRRARGCISMAGYNSVAEWLALRTPTVFVPRRSDSEQLTRLEGLQRTVGGPMCCAEANADGLRQALAALPRAGQTLSRQVWINGQEHFAKRVCEEIT
jgi:predicted glycosyltransferase